MRPETTQSVSSVERIAPCIVVIRRQKVILDSDLARLYGVTTKRLNEQARRNAERFPEDFRFQITAEELANLRSQNATSSGGHGGRRTLPYAYTEHGALMAASVLNSPRAVEVSVYVVRAFVRLRQMLATHSELAGKLEELERHLESRLDTHDEQIALLLEAIRQLLAPPEANLRRIGFRAKGKAK